MTLVTFEQRGGWGRLALNRPNAGNSVNPALVVDFTSAVEAAVAAPIRALLLAGEGANFCFGGDVRHFAAAGDRVADDLRMMASGFHAAQVKLSKLPIPIICAVQGAAVGGGFGLALSADFLICGKSAKFSTGYARLGLSADAGASYFLTRALGPRRAAALLMEARFFPSEEAAGLGLVDRIVDDTRLVAEAERWTQELANGPTSAYGAIKRLTEQARVNDFETQLSVETEELVGLANREDALAAIAAIGRGETPTFLD